MFKGWIRVARRSSILFELLLRKVVIPADARLSLAICAAHIAVHVEVIWRLQLHHDILQLLVVLSELLN